MKKYLIVTLLAGTAAWAAGCGQNSGPADANPAEKARSEPIAGEVVEGTRVEGAAPLPDPEAAVAAVDEGEAAGEDAADERPASSSRVIPGVELPPEAVLPPGVSQDFRAEILPTQTTHQALNFLNVDLPLGRYFFLPQNALDVAYLMNGEFQPDVFTAREAEIQSRIAAAREAAGNAVTVPWIRIEVDGREVVAQDVLKQYVATVLRKLIHAERDNEMEFRSNAEHLGRILQALKTDDGVRSADVIQGGGLMDFELWEQIVNYEPVRGTRGVAKIGVYLELQFAEAYKDMAKASRHARAEVLPQSTLVSGGDALGLVYKPGGFLDQGWNHISGLPNADLWYEGAANWSRVAEALRNVLASR
jgi:hypothetical protein